jgi:hypothetical protein
MVLRRGFSPAAHAFHNTLYSVTARVAARRPRASANFSPPPSRPEAVARQDNLPASLRLVQARRRGYTPCGLRAMIVDYEAPAIFTAT